LRKWQIPESQRGSRTLGSELKTAVLEDAKRRKTEKELEDGKIRALGL